MSRYTLYMSVNRQTWREDDLNGLRRTIAEDLFWGCPRWLPLISFLSRLGLKRLKHEGQKLRDFHVFNEQLSNTVVSRKHMQEIKFKNSKSQFREKQLNKFFGNKSLEYCHWSSQLINLRSLDIISITFIISLINSSVLEFRCPFLDLLFHRFVLKGRNPLVLFAAGPRRCDEGHRKCK